MDGGNDHLVELEIRNILFHDGSALHQDGRFENFAFIVYDTGTGFSIITVTEMRSFSCIVFDHHIMTIADQHTYRIRRECNTVFLESCLPRDTNLQLGPLGFYVKLFFKCFVTERGGDDRSLLRHEDVFLLGSFIKYTYFS